MSVTSGHCMGIATLSYGIASSKLLDSSEHGKGIAYDRNALPLGITLD